MILMIVSTQQVWSVDYIIIVININGVCYRGVFRNVANPYAVVTLFAAIVQTFTQTFRI